MQQLLSVNSNSYEKIYNIFYFVSLYLLINKLWYRFEPTEEMGCLKGIDPPKKKSKKL